MGEGSGVCLHTTHAAVGVNALHHYTIPSRHPALVDTCHHHLAAEAGRPDDRQGPCASLHPHQFRRPVGPPQAALLFVLRPGPRCCQGLHAPQHFQRPLGLPLTAAAAAHRPQPSPPTTMWVVYRPGTCTVYSVVHGSCSTTSQELRTASVIAKLMTTLHPSVKHTNGAVQPTAQKADEGHGCNQP